MTDALYVHTGTEVSQSNGEVTLMSILEIDLAPSFRRSTHYREVCY